MSGQRGTWPVAERAGFIASVGSVGATFEPGLLPRGWVDQAVVTGLISAVNYGVVTTSQAMVQALARRASSGLAVGGAGPRWAVYGGGFGGVVLGVGAQALPGSTDRSAVVRAAGLRLARGCAVGLLAQAADDLGDGEVAGLPWLRPSGRPFAALIGACIAAVTVHKQRSTADDRSLKVQLGDRFRSLVLGAGLSTALVGAGEIEHRVARRVGGALGRFTPLDAQAAHAIGHVAVLSVVGSTARGYLHRLAKASEAGSAALAALYADPPKAEDVHDGEPSTVPFGTLSTEGRRFLAARLTAEEIAAVTGSARANPVRVYVGLGSAASAAERVQLAMREMEAFGGFERSILCLATPAGTGFVNPAAVSALEYLTGGDCATVALQYSLRRSFYSLNRVPLAAEQNRLLLAAIAGRLAALPPDQRPTVVLYGESLGALAAQDTFPEPGFDPMRAAGVAHALFAGTPGSSVWARQWRNQPDVADPQAAIVEVASHAQWLELPDGRRDSTRVILLTHADDPVPRFDRRLALRPPGAADAPDSAARLRRWRPLTTYALTMIDLKNAVRTDPGHFTTTAHDYRGDVVRFVAAAYRLDCPPPVLDGIEAALRRRNADEAARLSRQ